MIEVTLEIKSPDGTERLPLSGDSMSIGRKEPSMFRIPSDGGLSRHHITIHRAPDRVWVIDEKSTNGAFVNGDAVPPGGRVLADGDQIQIGHQTTIKVSIAITETAPASVAPTSTSVATQSSNSSMLTFLLPAMAVVVIILGGVGLILYKASAKSGDKNGNREIAMSTNGGDSTPTPISDASATPNPTPSDMPVIVDTATPQLTPEPTPEPAALNQVKLYKAMTEDEKSEFIKQRAQHIAIMMGKRPYAFTPDAITHIKFWLDAFARRAGNKRTGLWGGDSAAILERGTRHAPTIIRAFNEHRVPTVVGLYIPFIETEYTNITTNNFAGAAGLFQFLGPTAEMYGVPSSERTNVEKMAPAAARYFRDNIMSFGNDSMSVALSIAGYNRAPESVKRDLRNVLAEKNNSDKERSFWTLIANQGKLDEYFQRENINYVPRFFAGAIFGETPWAFGIDLRPLSTYTQPATQPSPVEGN